ncbi:MAG: tRNA pseudouridine(13) synthase TruD [Planctomycetes bacterium]|nr:tRNA pseudouridine(13) synthase TruD [Planctomycetota bacterium]
MKLKHRPEDFLVEERLRPGRIAEAGPHAVYRIRKSGLSTLEVSMRLAKEAGVDLGRVRVCGWKDRRAVAVQHASVEGGPSISIEEPGLSVETIGRAAAPARSDWIEANAFSILVRDLGPEDLAALDRSLPDVRAEGLPNHFDDQRFGAARAGKGWPMAELLRGDEEKALLLLAATPGTNDPPEVAARKGHFRSAWGRFDRCAERAAGWHERSLFEHLLRRPRDFRGALRFVPRPERLIQALAFQSWIWNRCADRLLGAIVAPGRLGSMPADLGPLRFWRSPTGEERRRLDAVDLPLVGRGPRHGNCDREISEVLREEGLSVERLRSRGVRGFELKVARRSFVLRPDRLEAGAPEPDGEHPGRSAVRLALSLPRGAYATLVAKRLLAG